MIAYNNINYAEKHRKMERYRMKKLAKKQIFLIVAIITAILASGTSLAYILTTASDSATSSTAHGTEVSITVNFDDFSDQILIPQNAIATEDNETKTLEISGTVLLDYATEIDVNVKLSYLIYVDEMESTDLFNITNATTTLDVNSIEGEVFSLEVSLNAGEKLNDGAEITVKVTAELAS